MPISRLSLFIALCSFTTGVAAQSYGPVIDPTKPPPPPPVEPRPGVPGAGVPPTVERASTPAAPARPRYDLPDGVINRALPASAFALAINPTTGVLAAVDPAENVVRFYPKLSTEGDVRPTDRPVGALPCSVVFKGYKEKSYFFVLCSADRSVHVFDGATLESIKILTLPPGTPVQIAAARGSDSPFVFYRTGRRDTPNVVGVIHLDGMKDLGEIGTVSGEQIAVSADGSTLYARTLYSSPYTITPYRVEPSASSDGSGAGLALLAVHNGASAADTLIPDPFNTSVATGEFLQNDEALPGPTPVRLPGQALAFSETRPFLFTVTPRDELFVVSTLSKQIVARTHLTAYGVRTAAVNAGQGTYGVPIDMQPEFRFDASARQLVPVGETRRPRGVLGAVDETNQKLLIVLGKNCAVVDLRAVKVPEEPVLYAAPVVSADASVGGVPPFVVGRAGEVSIRALHPGAAISLLNAPRGMTLRQGRIAWTPGDDQVGPHDVSVVLTSGARTNTQVVRVLVRRPFVELPLPPDDVRLSPDGKLALVTFGAQPHPAADVPIACRLMLVDLQAHRILADRTMPAFSCEVAMDDHYVYAATDAAEVFHVLSRTDLSEVKRVFTPHRVHRVASVGGRFVFAQGPEQNSTGYRLPDFTRLHALPGGGGEDNAGGGSAAPPVLPPGPPPVFIGDGWYHRGVVLDDNLERARLLVRPLPFFPMQLALSREAISFPAEQPLLAGPGGPRSPDRFSPPSEAVGQLILRDPPVRIASHQEHEPRPRNTRSRAKLVARDLLTGRELNALVLHHEVLGNPKAAKSSRPNTMSSAAGVVVAAVGQRLYVVPTALLVPAKPPVPLHFAPVVQPLVIERDRPTVFTPTLRGGTGPYEFSLGSPHPAVSIDRASGKITIDPKRLGDVPSEALLPMISTNGPNGRTLTAAEAVETARSVLAPRFTQLVGRAPRGIPVSLLLSVAARDREQRATRLDFALFYEVPADTALAWYTAQEERRRRYREQNPDHADPAPAPRPAPSSTGNGVATLQQVRRRTDALEKSMDELRSKNTTLERRNAELERRNIELEAQVKLLKELTAGRKSPDGGTEK